MTVVGNPVNSNNSVKVLSARSPLASKGGVCVCVCRNISLAAIASLL